MGCEQCFHTFYTGNPGDDVEAACNCDCHDSSFDDDDCCNDCDLPYEHCTCYGEND